MKNSRRFFRQHWVHRTAALLVVGMAFAWFNTQSHGQAHAAKTAANNASSQASQEERIRKIEATVVEIPRGDKEPLRASLP